MTDRQNETTRKAWVGEVEKGEYFRRPRYKSTLQAATLYDDTEDVPDYCTPRRVEVREWEERGEPEAWDGEYHRHEPDGFEIYMWTDDGELVRSALFPGVVSAETAFVALEERVNRHTAIPVTIPTTPRREVRLIEEEEEAPEPKVARQRICRCGRSTPLVAWIFNCGECGYRGPPFEPRHDFRNPAQSFTAEEKGVRTEGLRADAPTQPECGCREAIRRLEVEVEDRTGSYHTPEYNRGRQSGMGFALAILRECCEDDA